MMNDSKKITSYKDLIVWQRSIYLVVAVYKLTEQLPPDEKFGLVAQMRRAAVSIPSNIAEGKARNTKKDFTHYISISFGSASELETQIIVCKQLPFGAQLDYNEVEGLLTEVLKMLATLRRKLQT